MRDARPLTRCRLRFHRRTPAPARPRQDCRTAVPRTVTAMTRAPSTSSPRANVQFRDPISRSHPTGKAMKDYAVQEMPDIDNPDLIRDCVTVQTMRCTLSALVRHLISQLTVTPFTVPIRVVLSILYRLAEGAISIELLCRKNRVRDAAILLLSLHELRLDLQYIARNPRRADIWLDHTEDNRKPWRVAEQMADIYTTQDEFDAERSIYRQYSMVKHCNPVGQTFSFPILITHNPQPGP